MHVIQARNVNDAYLLGMQHLTGHGMRNPSRAGEVLVSNHPVTTVYNRPQERVLFEPNRDANPFFHLMESVWMLAGMRDARWLDRYVKDFSKRFAEDDGDAHGAYGYRWRKHFRGQAVMVGEPISKEGDQTLAVWEFPALDQIQMCGKILFDDPTSRQAVMSMWDPAIDLGAKKKDIPCNDLVMFRSRHDGLEKCWYLDTTVLCRSNDAVWGAYGANAVHMSVMAEVVAGLAGMKLGRYYQVSNNFHVYTNVLEKVWPPVETMDPYTYGMVAATPILEGTNWHYQTADGRQSIRENALQLLDDCESWVNAVGTTVPIASRWFHDVIDPMQQLHNTWKEDKNKALSQLKMGPWSDWKHAAAQWMSRRLNPTLRRVEEARAQ